MYDSRNDIKNCLVLASWNAWAAIVHAVLLKLEEFLARPFRIHEWLVFAFAMTLRLCANDAHVEHTESSSFSTSLV